MTDSDKIKLGAADWKTQAALSFSKHGPWAFMSLLLVGSFLYGLFQAGAAAGPVLTEWIAATRALEQKNSESIAEMLAAQTRASMEHDALIKSSAILQEAIKLRANEHETHSQQMDGQGSQLARVIELLEAANDLMKDVPELRQEEVQLLRDLKKLNEQRIGELQYLNGTEKPDGS